LEGNPTLQANTDELLILFDNMARVPVFLKDEAINKSGTNTERGVAYTLCENFETPKIILKKSFYQKANQKQLTNILKHELTHAWLCRRKQMSGHDERFRQKFNEVGGFGN
jgi:predicted SprT family Zn-dependent metalloprotease